MVKRLFTSFFFLCLFTGSANAQIVPTPTVKKLSQSLGPIQIAPLPKPIKNPVYVPNQLIITYKPGGSPEQILDTINKRKKSTSTPIGFLKFQVLEFFGKITPLSAYENQLKKIQEANKNANVIKTETISVSLETPVVKIILKDGTDIEKAIKIFQTLPQVKSVERNYYRFTTGTKIASTEVTATDTIVSPNKYIVQYAPGQTPEDIKTQVESRIEASNNPIFGAIRIAAENTVITVQGNPLPEEKLQMIEQVSNEVGKREEKPLLKQTPTLPASLQNTRVITTDGKTSLSETLDAYRSIPGVISIEPVRYVFATAEPNDPGYNKQWNLTKIQAPVAWDTTKGSNNVIVAVIDSGVDYNHPDLTTHVIKGRDIINNDNDPMDTCGHGTHVSGIIGALTDNSVGVAGINWDVKILAIKVMDKIMNPSTGKLDCGTNDGTMIITGIQDAVDNGAKVINMSLGGPGACPAVYQNMINYATDRGVTVVVAAGNDSIDASSFAPANCSGVINVGATGPTDTRASYSNYGSNVTISAPGGDSSVKCADEGCILSTYIQDGVEGYAKSAGTSMAAPHVAGAAALLLSIDPSLTPNQIKDYLAQNADSISTDRPIGSRLNLAKAVQAVSGGDTPPTSVPTTPPDVTATPVPTLPPDITATPTETQPTDAPDPTDIITPTPPKEATWDITFSFKLPGIGTSAGDNDNPIPVSKPVFLTFVGENGDSNKIKLNNATVYSNGVFKENPQGGTMEGNIPPAGTYQVKISTNNTLDKLTPGFFTITNEPVLNLPFVALTPGDINQDRILDLLDYNILISCIQKSCSHDIFSLADLNSDTLVDAKDLNVFLRQLQTREGD